MDELQQVVEPFFPASSGGLNNLPGPSEPTPFITIIPDSDDRKQDSPSLADEFPFLDMPSPQFHALESITRDMQDEIPLIDYGERRQQLEDFLRFRVSSGVEAKYDEGLVELQVQVEIRIENALRKEA